MSDVVRRLSGMLPLLSCKKKILIASAYSNKIKDAFKKINAGQNADAELKNIIALVPYMSVSIISAETVNNTNFVSTFGILIYVREYDHWISFRFIVI